MNPVPDLNNATALAATGQTRATAAPRIKLLPDGFSIDHADAEHGETVALINSDGVLEIAMRDANAADTIGAGRGSPLLLRL